VLERTTSSILHDLSKTAAACHESRFRRKSVEKIFMRTLAFQSGWSMLLSREPALIMQRRIRTRRSFGKSARLYSIELAPHIVFLPFNEMPKKARQLCRPMD